MENPSESSAEQAPPSQIEVNGETTVNEMFDLGISHGCPLQIHTATALVRDSNGKVQEVPSVVVVGMGLTVGPIVNFTRELGELLQAVDPRMGVVTITQDGPNPNAN
jgi:hypothetical protein